MMQWLQGKNQEALLAKEVIHPEKNIVEKLTCHQLCLQYKGRNYVYGFVSEDYPAIMTDTVAKGIVIYYLYNINRARALQVFSRILEGKNLGFIRINCRRSKGF